MKTPYTLSTQQSKLTDLVRRLEESNHNFGMDIATLERSLKQQDGTPLEKIARRADSLDDDSLSYALLVTERRLARLPIMLSVVYFVAGLMLSMTVLLSETLNVFYWLVVLMAANLALMLRSLLAHRHNEGKLPFERVFDKLSPQDPLEQHAHAIHLDERQSTRYWHALTLTQHTALATLAGVMVGAMMTYALDSNLFVNQSNAYVGGLAKLANVINLIPSLFGSSLDGFALKPSDLLYFLLMSILCYAVLPRAVLWGFCHLKTKTCPYRIDTTLYYYDNLYRKFSHKISDDDDYMPYHAKPELAHIDPTVQKITATLYRPAIDETWYRFGAGFKVYDFGVLHNDADELERLSAIIDIKKVGVYLGVFVDNFPDEQTCNLLVSLKKLSKHGLAVELLAVVGNDAFNDFYQDWQAFLLKEHIAEVRYS